MSGIQDLTGLLHNFTAVVAPTGSDDLTLGYGVGSRWIDVSSGLEYTCVDATFTAAVWKTGGASWPVVAVNNTNYTVTATDAGRLILCTTNAASSIISLPNILTVASGFTVAISKNHAANTVTITTNGVNVIERLGAAVSSVVLNRAGGSVYLVSNGSNWTIIGDNGATYEHVVDQTNPHGVTSTQVGAIPLTQKAAAGGVPSLNGAIKVIQEPATKGAVNGIAPLDAGSKVPVVNLPAATTVAQGISERATLAEVTAGIDDVRYVSPLRLAQRLAAIPGASTVLQGLIELATQAEVNTGIDTVRAVTPATLAARLAGFKSIGILVGVVGDGGTVPIPTGFTRAQCYHMISMNLDGMDDHSYDAWMTLSLSVNQATGLVSSYHRMTAPYWINIQVTCNYMVIGLK